MDESARQLVRDWLTRANHDLRSSFSKFAKAASVLTPYVSAFRYPGGFDFAFQQPVHFALHF
jgi:hypothetical protein